MPKQLKLSDIRIELKFNKNNGLSVFSIRDLVEHPEEYRIDFDVFLETKGKNLQRPFVWTLLQKQELILSMLKGIALPAICIIQNSKVESDKRRDRVYEVIDGKQRLSTILAFVKGEFNIEVNGKEYNITQLEEPARRLIINHYVKADVAYSYTYANGSKEAFITDEEKIAWFEMINFAGTPQDIEHLIDLKS